ncbi:E3 ubiquitin protein ligase RIN2-like [Wolffia australiana]
MAVSALHVSLICTVLSFLCLQWWTSTFYVRIRRQSLVDGGKEEDAGRILELLLGSRTTILLLLNFVLNVFALAILGLKSLFFLQLNSSETRKVVERALNYVFYKGIILLLIIPPNVLQVAIWSGWVATLCSLKMFQTLARDRLERLNASPSATPWTFFRVFSALLMVLSTDLFWMRFCMNIYNALDSTMLLLLFFEPLSIAFETLQALMIHGFHLLELWNRQSANHVMDCLGFKSIKFTKGCFGEWKGIVMRDFSFLLDMLSLITSLGHYLVIWWLNGLGFHLLDAVLFMNIRGVIFGIIKRVKAYFKLRKALLSLDVALPDATSDELHTFDDECAICREPMSRAKKLSCNHLFHLSCLKSWLDQGLADVYSCPTCRRPLFLSGSRDNPGSSRREASTLEQLSPSNPEPDNRGAPAPLMDNIWSGSDNASTSGGRATGLDRVQLMMRHLATAGESYSHGSLEEAGWNIWPGSSPSGRNSAGLRLRTPHPSSLSDTSSEMLAMAGRVREVLPHIPDELIIQDLTRTNNVAVTVNNFLPS